MPISCFIGTHFHFSINFADKAVINFNRLSFHTVLAVLALVYHDLLNQRIEQVGGKLCGTRAFLNARYPLFSVDYTLLFGDFGRMYLFRVFR